MATQTNAAETKNETRKDVQQIVNDKIIEFLQKGIVPWHVSWAKAGVPTNLALKTPYRGINATMLAALGYERNLFISSKQLKEIGGDIKADAKPSIVTYWNKSEKQLEGGKDNWTLRYGTVFNIEQCKFAKGQVFPEIVGESDPVSDCLKIINGMPNAPVIKQKESKEYYDIRLDIINIPKQNSFPTETGYYGAYLRELVHSTGHRTRLNRKDLAQMIEYGYDAFTHEELVGEIACNHLLSLAGIVTDYLATQSYIDGWIKKLQSDKYILLSAANAAQKAIDYILNIKEHKETAEE